MNHLADSFIQSDLVTSGVNQEQVGVKEQLAQGCLQVSMCTLGIEPSASGVETPLATTLGACPLYRTD